MSTIKESLKNAFLNALDEGVDSTKEMIQQNVVPSFDDMGMAKVAPGEFAQDEITDKENLVNTAEMSNDTDFEGKATNEEAGINKVIDAAEDMMKDIVDISGDNCDHCHHDHDDKEEIEKMHVFEFGESYMGKIIDRVLGGKTCEEYLTAFNESGKKEKKYTYKRSASGEYEIRGEDGKIASVCDSKEEAEEWIKEHNKFLAESNYAGPRDWNPDTRINTSDVINVLKHEIGDGSEAIHVDQIYDKDRNDAYKVSQIDKDLLPKKIQVETSILELDDEGVYHVNKISDTYPLPK